LREGLRAAGAAAPDSPRHHPPDWRNVTMDDDESRRNCGCGVNTLGEDPVLRQGGAQPLDVALEDLVPALKDDEAFVEIDDEAANVKEHCSRTRHGDPEDNAPDPDLARDEIDSLTLAKRRLGERLPGVVVIEAVHHPDTLYDTD
jgi:hypothetical protein